MNCMGYSLTSLIEQTQQLHQVRKVDLRSGDWLFVKTRNSLYSIRVVGGGFYVVSGGWFDRKGFSPMTTTITGCTWGGSAIKLDIVGACGLQLEFGNRLITSTIQKIILFPCGCLN